MIVVGCPASVSLAQRIAKKLKCKYTTLEHRHYPDGEIYIRFMKKVKGETVVLVQTLALSDNSGPNHKIMELLIAAHTARDLGAKKIVLVMPYLAYMRQDIRFNPGESISSRAVGEVLSLYADAVITIDPHLHRYKSLREVYHADPCVLGAAGLISEYIKGRFKNPFIVGPDKESYQWASKVAEPLGCGHTVLLKKRYSDRHVEVFFQEEVDVRGKDIIIVDDIISTGHTIVEAVKGVRKLGAKKIHVIGVHGIFAEGALSKIRKAGAKSVVTTNTVPGRTAEIDVSGLIAASLKGF